MIVISLGNAAGAHAPSAFASATLPDWIMIALVVIGLVIGGSLVRLLVGIRDRFPEPSVKHDKFVEALLKGVRKQTERLQREFNELLRTPPTLPNDALTYVRDLRRLLRESTAFITHMRTNPLPEWPGPDLANAFADWAGVIDSMDALLEDLFADVTTAVERHSWTELLEQYRREGWYLRQDVDKLTALKTAIEKEAKPFQKKKKEEAKAHGGGDHH